MSIEQLSIEPVGDEEVVRQIESAGPLKAAWIRLSKIRTALVALVIISFMVTLAIASFIGISITPYTFDQTSTDLLSDPSLRHWMGTDELGRDLMTRVIFGSRLSISIGLITALVALIIGTIYGATAGYCGGKTDSLLMRGVDIVYSLPDLLVMILVGVLVGRGTQGILMALALVSWMGTARLVRAQFMQLKNEEFIEAARASGQSTFPMICKHFLPNAMGPIIVALTFIVPSAILSESTLSFIGLGLSPPACSWGTLAADGWRSLRTHPHLILFPSLFIFMTVLSFNFLGDGLRDALDPRTRLRK